MMIAKKKSGVDSIFFKFDVKAHREFCLSYL